MAALREGLMRSFIAWEIEVHQPGRRPFVGRVKGAMYRDGTPHHFRVVDSDNVMWLVPPAWLSDHSLRTAEMAMDRTDARFLHILQTVPHDLIRRVMAHVMEMPEDSTLAEMTAQLECRHAELVH